MSAQVTEAHLRLANQLVSSPPSPLVLATLIADSEAKATAQLRADCDYNHECINRLASATGTLGEKSERVVEVALSTIARAERAEAELATERARLRQIALDACRSAKITPIIWYPKRYAIDPNDFGIINEQQVEACAQAIDAAMKEGAP